MVFAACPGAGWVQGQRQKCLGCTRLLPPKPQRSLWLGPPELTAEPASGCPAHRGAGRASVLCSKVALLVPSMLMGRRRRDTLVPTRCGCSSLGHPHLPDAPEQQSRSSASAILCFHRSQTAAQPPGSTMNNGGVSGSPDSPGGLSPGLCP